MSNKGQQGIVSRIEATMSPNSEKASGETEDTEIEADEKSIDLQKEGRRGVQFPWKLHSLLERAENEGNDHIISWLPDGKSFKVHKKEEFCASIMPKYFNSNKYKTWQRSLNLWGFESIVRGPAKGAIRHDAFVRGLPELCKTMTRVKIKGAYPRPLHSHGSPKTSPRPTLASVPLVPTQNRLAAVGFGPASTLNANKPVISDFLRSKASPRASDAMLEAALIQRLAAAQKPSPLLLAGLQQGLLGSASQAALSQSTANRWLPSHLGVRQWASAFTAPSLLQQTPVANRLISAINTATAALDVIRQEEAELMRRAGV